MKKPSTNLENCESAQGDQWPPATSTVLVGQSMEAVLRERPLAVEITIDSEDWGKLVRLIEIAG